MGLQGGAGGPCITARDEPCHSTHPALLNHPHINTRERGGEEGWDAERLRAREGERLREGVSGETEGRDKLRCRMKGGYEGWRQRNR